jgi:hypothetical protein
MSINTLDQYIASAKQKIQFVKTAARTTVIGGWYSMFDLAGAPGAGVLAGTSASPGVIPDDTIAGYPPINAFGGGALGYLSRFEFANSAACRIQIFDRLCVAGAFAFNAAAAAIGSASYAARVPNTDYKGLEIWTEAVTAFTLNQTWNVQYTNENGTTGHTTGAVGIGAAPTLGRAFQLPLQAGDAGVSVLEAVTGAVGSAGTANIMVLRPLISARVKAINDGDVYDLIRTGLVQCYDNSALYMLIASDTTASGIPEMSVEIANG